MKKETRVYLIKISEVDFLNPKNKDLISGIINISNERFMDIAEEQGYVYTIKRFEKALIEDIHDIDDYLVRFIEVGTSDKENEILRNLILQEMDSVNKLNANILSRINAEEYLNELKNIYNQLI